MDKVFHLAVGQSPAELPSTEERLVWLENALPKAVAENADLLLLPELFATGYNIGDDLIARAQPADGPFAQKVAALAKTHGVAIHYGFAENYGGALFNAAQCFGPDGRRLASHRKLAIPPGFEQDYFTPGQGCSLFTYRGMRIATLICYDIEFPETARHVASLGADLILAPTALGAQWEWVSTQMIPTRAYENGVYLAYANSAGIERGMEFLGQSFIAAPDGQELVRAGPKADIIFGKLKPERICAAKARLPYLRDHILIKTDI
jgi:predicted amidohydrolase